MPLFMFHPKSNSDLNVARVTYLKKRKQCECGNPATIRKGNWHICERCNDIEQARNTRVHREGDGYQPTIYSLTLPKKQQH